MSLSLKASGLLLFLALWQAPCLAQAGLPNDDLLDDEENVEIIEDEGRTVYEYRQNGLLTIIKVVPKNGLPYYMVPADDSAHFTDLEQRNKLYPRWVIVEW